MTRTLTAVNTAPDSENQIHGAAAAEYGFTGGLVPGVDVLGYLVHPAVARWGEAWFERGHMVGRLIAPVYDGEQLTIERDAVETASVTTESVEAASIEALWTASGRDGSLRAEATLSLRPDTPHEDPPDPSDWPTAPLPEPDARTAAAAHLLEPDTVLGTQHATFHADRAPHYLDEISEDHPLFRDEQLAHPGWLLRFANWSLSSTVRLGPWIHVASDATWFRPVRDGDRLEVRGKVTRRWEAKGHEFVDVDVLYLVGDSVMARVLQTAIWQPRRGAHT